MNYYILMNGRVQEHKKTLDECVNRIHTLEKIFRHSKFHICVSGWQYKN